MDDEYVWALDGTEDVAFIAVTLSDVFWYNIKINILEIQRMRHLCIDNGFKSQNTNTQKIILFM